MRVCAEAQGRVSCGGTACLRSSTLGGAVDLSSEEAAVPLIFTPSSVPSIGSTPAAGESGPATSDRADSGVLRALELLAFREPESAIILSHVLRGLAAFADSVRITEVVSSMT